MGSNNRLTFSSCLSALFLTLCGCNILSSSPSMSAYLSPSFDHYRIRKAVLLPLEGKTEIESGRITGALKRSLQKIQKFEVIPATRQQLQRICPEIVSHKNTLSATAILNLAKAYSVQAIIEGEISVYRTTPPALGLRVRLISAYDGSILWAADTLSKDRNFYSTDDDIEERLTSLSPGIFVQNTCDRIAATLRK